jgi:hypothetical protein
MFLCFQVKSRPGGYLSPIKQGTVITGSNLVTTMYERSIDPEGHWPDNFNTSTGYWKHLDWILERLSTSLTKQRI